MSQNSSETETSDPRAILKDGDVLRLEISPKYATIEVIPNGNEGQDANFPRNLHNAAELFLKCGLVPNAVKLKECTDALLEVYATDPSKAVRLGRACVCWECGYCGIPKNYVETQEKPGPCANCTGSTQINWVRILGPPSDDSPSPSVLPWVEVAAKTQQEKDEELAAKRAAVEARVTAALKAREEAEKKASAST